MILLLGTILVFAVTVRTYDEKMQHIRDNHEMELKAIRNHYSSKTAMLARDLAAAQANKKKATFLEKESEASGAQTRYGYPVCTIPDIAHLADYISLQSAFIQSYNDYLKSLPGSRKER